MKTKKKLIKNKLKTDNYYDILFTFLFGGMIGLLLFYSNIYYASIIELGFNPHSLGTNIISFIGLILCMFITFIYVKR